MSELYNTSTPDHRSHWFWRALVPLVLLVGLLHTLLYYFFVPRKSLPVFSQARKPLNIAHRGGELLGPSNTLAAFAVAYRLGVTVFETDIHMTRDGHLVLIHDDTVDRTTNGTGRVDSFTLAELKQLDAGYTFQDLQGQYSYRGQGVTISTLAELFETYGDRCYYNIDMKEPYPQGGPSQIEYRLWELVQNYGLERNVVVSSFYQSLINSFATLSQGRVALGAGRSEVARFVLCHKFGLPAFYFPSAHAIQIPTWSTGFNLADRRLINGAHRLGLQIHYWTIDDKPTMRKLLQLGADGLITNRPDLLKEVIEEMHLK